eukprot:gene11503-2094_t
MPQRSRNVSYGKARSLFEERWEVAWGAPGFELESGCHELARGAEGAPEMRLYCGDALQPLPDDCTFDVLFDKCKGLNGCPMLLPSCLAQDAFGALHPEDRAPYMNLLRTRYLSPGALCLLEGCERPDAAGPPFDLRLPTSPAYATGNNANVEESGGEAPPAPSPSAVAEHWTGPGKGFVLLEVLRGLTERRNGWINVTYVLRYHGKE